MTSSSTPGGPASPEPLPPAADAPLGLVPLLEPREGLPPVTDTAAALAAAVEALAAGTGPVAVDAERASGYKYSQRAYLVQIRRQGAGTFLIDPIACPDLSALAGDGPALAGAEWVLHAASQDLACLAEVGMRPPARRADGTGGLFDTELGARLGGHERVGLGPLVAEVLKLELEKGHSASDWSTRPLPEAWLRYAALDVEVLVEVRDIIEDELRGAGKLDWARQEFDAVASAPPPKPRAEPWRRTSGLHKVRRPRQLAVVRALWEARDELARRRDMTPTRVLPDQAIIDSALSLPGTAPQMRAIPGFSGRMRSGDVPRYFEALTKARQLKDAELPKPGAAPSDGPPPVRAWADKDPVAAERLTAAREAVGTLAAEHSLPVENMLAPDSLRRLCWTPPTPAPSDEQVAAFLSAAGARPWQVALTSKTIGEALREVAGRERVAGE
ncbi:ribonuclease D [Catenulispora sp. MAP12-49]|uniref:HRDC domain-containing protein n=1 Tax=unclassified Catenulispora TaxID=414885 RepID=UPI003514BF86